MVQMNIDIDRIQLRMKTEISSFRAGNITNEAVEMLKGLLEYHSYENRRPGSNLHKDSLKMPTINIKESDTDTEISRAIATEIYRALINEGGF